MKVVILAGGQGTRLAEETAIKPKPMVQIGGREMLWHIMMIYSHYGFKEFVIALGYKGEVIKRYFLDYCLLNSDLTVSLTDGQATIHAGLRLDWTVHLVDTGVATMTGGRLRRLRSWLADETFMLTYGDGVADIDISRLLAFHRSHGRLATVTAVRPPARFGALEFDRDRVLQFSEKPQTGEGWINGGFFVLEPAVLDLIVDDRTHWEGEPLEQLATTGELFAYRHESFWQSMDTMRDVRLLESLWQSARPPWKVW
jgi:glucose-1-phosphate cytidylyltransferase